MEDFDIIPQYFISDPLEDTLRHLQEAEENEIASRNLNKEKSTDRYEHYGPFRLFDLPIEIRSIIYRHAIPVGACAAVAMCPTPRGYSVQTFAYNELEGMMQADNNKGVAASGLHDASKKLRAEVATIYRTSFNLVLPQLETASWVLRSLKNWGAFPFLKDVNLKVFFAPSMHAVRDKRDTLMEYFTTESSVPPLENLTHCLALTRVHFDVAVVDCNQQCQIGPIFERKARRLLGSQFTISARTTTCEHCPPNSHLNDPAVFASRRNFVPKMRVDANRIGDPMELLPSSTIERWKWTCAPKTNVWDITRFKFNIDLQKFTRVVGLSDLISQYRRDAMIDKAAAKQKLQVTAQELRESICDTSGCTAPCRGIPTDPRYARAYCCRFCELAWFCPDHYFVGQHTFRGKHWIEGYCLKRPLPADDGMVHMSPVGDITTDRIYDEP